LGVPARDRVGVLRHHPGITGAALPEDYRQVLTDLRREVRASRAGRSLREVAE
jgi:hypothetical protein